MLSSLVDNVSWHTPATISHRMSETQMKNLERLYFPFLMAVFMTSIMSFTLTAIHRGFSPDFLLDWGRAFGLAFPIAFFSVIFVAPIVHKLSEALKKKTPAVS
jgi:hypothetical protein